MNRQISYALKTPDIGSVSLGWDVVQKTTGWIEEAQKFLMMGVGKCIQGALASQDYEQ